jgi:hypothetical protein
MILSQLLFPIPSRLVFEETIACDWYDGITSGLAMSMRLDTAFRFDIIAWGPEQETRVFVFSPLDRQGFREAVGLLSSKEAPNWPIWFPKWSIWEPGSSPLKDEINRILSNSKPPEFAVASDSMFETLFASRPLDGRTRGLLPSQFDGFPSRDNFDEWREFLSLPR